MARAVALLRGINVGGRRTLPMARLRSLFTEAGCEDVETYIQSGNVVFRRAGRLGTAFADELERRIDEATGLDDVAVVLRTFSDLDKVVEGNPFTGAEPTKLFVAFLRERVAAAAVDRVRSAAPPPEELVTAGRELYLHLPAGAGRAKLPGIVDRLPTPVTVRNWRTVTKLHAMAAD